ncbi:MAG TPA: hypothetical protein DHV55_18655, partial [Clostridiaceae bacterium]|nr:hypothetical protein [Clostridiaceae bacterium]
MAKHKGIYQRGEVYWIRYTGVDGKQCRESTKSDKLKDDQDLLKLRQADVVRGEQPDVIKIKNHTFRELAERYLDYCSNQRNFANKRYMINNLVLDFGNVPLKNFSLLLLEKYQARLLSENRKPLKGTDTPRPPIEEATVNRRIATIKAMFTKALDWNMVSEAVYKQVHKVKMFRETITRDAFLSRDKIKALLDACDEQVTTRTGRKIGLKQSHLKPIIIFALNTGCRKEEILSLKWEQVDLVHGFINLNRTKNGERRQIPINDTLQEMLRGIVRRLDVPWVFYDPETGKRFRDVKRSF